MLYIDHVMYVQSALSMMMSRWERNLREIVFEGMKFDSKIRIRWNWGRVCRKDFE